MAPGENTFYFEAGRQVVQSGRAAREMNMSKTSRARRAAASAVALLAALALEAHATVPKKVLLPATPVHPALWPKSKSPIGLDPAMEARIGKIIAGMTVEEKVGQVIQPEWK